MGCLCAQNKASDTCLGFDLNLDSCVAGSRFGLEEEGNAQLVMMQASKSRWAALLCGIVCLC